MDMKKVEFISRVMYRCIITDRLKQMFIERECEGIYTDLMLIVSSKTFSYPIYKIQIKKVKWANNMSSS